MRSRKLVSSLIDILSEVEGLSGPSSSDSDSRTNLPFTLGGARASPKVQLLFGAGTRSDLSMDRIEDESLITEESIQEQEETTNIIPEDEILELNSEITPEFENKTQVEEIVEQKHQDEIHIRAQRLYRIRRGSDARTQHISQHRNGRSIPARGGGDDGVL